jgi:hypothetical protein
LSGPAKSDLAVRDMVGHAVGSWCVVKNSCASSYIQHVLPPPPKVSNAVLTYIHTL